MELRLITKDDAAAFQSLRLEALRESPSAFSADYETNSRQPLSYFAARIHTESDNFVLGAFQDSELVGICGFFRSDGPKLRHKGNIWSMYVTPKLRRSGVGRQILNEILRRARDVIGIEQVLISVSADNLRARDLYLSSGFQIFGREPRALKVDEQYHDEEHMIQLF